MAEEIRKLAESSAQNTKEITAHLKDLISSIENANIKVNSSGKAFTEISVEIENVSNAFIGVRNNVQQLNSISEELRAAGTELTDSTSIIDTEIDGLAESHNNIKDDVQSIVNLSSQIASGMVEILQGITLVTQSSQDISALSGELSKHGELLNQEINLLDMD